MFTYSDLLVLAEDDGATLKNFNTVTYKSGWQVATEGYAYKEPAAAWVRVLLLKGNCGIWYSNGIYYIDKSKRVDTKKEALKIGREFSQISIYGWKLGRLAYC